MVDFSLSLTDSFGLLVPEEEKRKLRATNREAFTFYNLQLTPDDCEMLVQTTQTALRENDLVCFGETITPRLIHWFLQAGYFRNYPAEIAELTEIFYRYKSELQEICEENDQRSCMLSDNAILFYMYRFYICPACAGDTEALSGLMSQIIVPAMNRLIHRRNQKRKANLAKISGNERLALYADQIAALTRSDEDLYAEDMDRRDRLFRSAMLGDTGGYRPAEPDYDARFADPAYIMEDDPYASYDDERPVFGTFTEELDELLSHDPELLLPSESLEQEWDDMADQWAADDAACSELYQ
ncbi:MAG: hypothetical protein IK130_11570 [Oscillospiraceae bacterium]|nr:hypothetical protein [Oscillospiraceae bacterium]